MKKLFMLSIATLTSSLFTLKAQNLVPNWSFEQIDTCPPWVIYNATGWKNVMVCGDLYNACLPNGEPYADTVPTPLCNWTYFYTDTTGNGDAGIDAYEVCPSCPYPPNLHEIIGCQLYSSLVIGKKYFVSFAVRLGLCPGSDFNGAISKLGALFSTVSYAMPIDSANSYTANERASKVLIKNRAQVYTNNVIKDTTYWTVILGSFFADSTYKYINIGDFFDDSLSNFTLLENDTSYTSEEYAYYFIDDVCVTSDSLNSCGIEAGIDGITKGNHSINIYPNPAIKSTVIYISHFSNSLPGHISIYDISARKVRDEPITLEDGKFILQKSNLSDGIYDIFIQINKQIFNTKIVFTH